VQKGKSDEITIRNVGKSLLINSLSGAKG